MSIKKIPLSGGEVDKAQFVFDNGDLSAVEQIMAEWKFKDEESLLRFALAVLVKAKNNSITIKNDAGADQTLKPASDLLAQGTDAT